MKLPGSQSHSRVLDAQPATHPAAELAAGKGGAAPMCLRIATVVLVVSLLLPTGLAFSASGPDAQEPQPAASVDIETIVVTGQRPGVLKALMMDFILEIGDPATRGRGYARWRDPVCVGVYNLPNRSVAQYIADRISLIALETAALKTGSPGCEPNLHIVFSPDARELASRMVEDSPRMFRPFGGTEGTTQGLVALEQFKSSEAPVRWWQITMVVDEHGYPAVPLPGWGNSTTVRGVASRLKSPINDAIWGSLVIVDAGKVKDLSWPQLVDYLAMVSLAQVNPNAQPSGYDSILNLFSDDTPPLRMTDMDHIYLRSLYEMDTMMLPHTQRGVFSSMMVRVQRKTESTLR